MSFMVFGIKVFRFYAVVVAMVLSCVCVGNAAAQDAPMHVSCQVAKLTNNGKTYSQVRYATFKSLKRAIKVKNSLVEAVAAVNAIGATGAEIDNAIVASGASWKDSRPNGSFDLSVMAGQAVVVFCDEEEAPLL